MDFADEFVTDGNWTYNDTTTEAWMTSVMTTLRDDRTTSNDDSGDGGDSGENPTAMIVGSVFAVLALIVITVIVTLLIVRFCCARNVSICPSKCCFCCRKPEAPPPKPPGLSDIDHPRIKLDDINTKDDDATADGVTVRAGPFYENKESIRTQGRAKKNTYVDEGAQEVYVNVEDADTPEALKANDVTVDVENDDTQQLYLNDQEEAEEIGKIAREGTQRAAHVHDNNQNDVSQQIYYNEDEEAVNLREIARHGTQRSAPIDVTTCTATAHVPGETVHDDKAPADYEQEEYVNMGQVLTSTKSGHPHSPAKTTPSRGADASALMVEKRTSQASSTGSQAPSTGNRRSLSEKRKAASQSGTYANQSVVNQMLGITVAIPADGTDDVVTSQHTPPAAQPKQQEKPKPRAKPPVAKRKPSIPAAQTKQTHPVHQPSEDRDDIYVYESRDNAAANQKQAAVSKAPVKSTTAKAAAHEDPDDVYLAPDSEDMYLAPDFDANAQRNATEHEQDTYTPMNNVTTMIQRLNAAKNAKLSDTLVGNSNQAFAKCDDDQTIYENVT